MMIVTHGATDVTTYFHLRLAADGTDATGLTIANMDLTYVRTLEEPAAKVDAQALADQDTAHTDNFAIEIDGTNMPGVYRVDWPDAAFAASAAEVILTVKCATVFTESLRVKLVSATRGLAGTALPAAAADAAGGLPISDAGGLDLDAQVVTKINDILVDTAEIGAAGAGLTNINLPNQTMDIIGNITGNLSGSVGSVTGAVGSVAANGLSASSLAADAVDEILDEQIGDGTITMRQALRILIAGMAGKLSGAATTTVTIRNLADSADVVVATVDADGNRSATTVTP